MCESKCVVWRGVAWRSGLKSRFGATENSKVGQNVPIPIFRLSDFQKAPLPRNCDVRVRPALLDPLPHAQLPIYLYHLHTEFKYIIYFIYNKSLLAIFSLILINTFLDLLFSFILIIEINFSFIKNNSIFNI